MTGWAGQAGPAVLPEPRDPPPLTGDPERVDEAGGRLVVAAAVLASPAPDDVEGWRGLTADAARRAARRAGVEAAATAAASRALGLALLRHAAGLRLLATQHAELVTRGVVLRRARAELVARTAAGAAGGEAVLLAAQVAGLGADLRRHEAAVLAWVAARGAADAALALGAGAAERLVAGRLPGTAVASAATGALAALLGRQVAALLPGGTAAGGTAAGRRAGAAEVAQAAAQWWRGLPADARWSLVVGAPALVGRLDGLPPAVRDRANRLVLARDLVTLTARAGAGALDGEARRRLPLALAGARALAVAADDRDARSGEPRPALLWEWSPQAHGGEGAAVLALGDPVRSAHVAVLVPGLGTAPEDLPARAADADHLHDAARAVSADSVAVVAWLAHDAPDRWLSGDLDAWGVADPAVAAEGGRLLADDLAGLPATRTSDPHLVVVGHSHGAVVVAHAADAGLPADDVVLLGSPGAGPARTAEDVGTRVWVGSASSDPVTSLGDEGLVGGLGTLGVDPAGEAYAARRFAAEHPDRDEGLRWSPDQHRGYLEPGGESLTALGLLLGGRPDDVALVEHRRDPWWRPPLDPEAGRALDEPLR